MGSGSSIARDAAGLVLLDDNFRSIVTAMKEGRVIVSNIRRMLFYLLSTNTGEVLVMIGALLLSHQLPLEPVQILWINIVTDTFFVIPLGLEPPEDNVMQRPPEPHDAPILPRVTIVRMAIIAVLMATVSLVVYGYYSETLGHYAASTLTFMGLASLQWANAFNARSNYQSIFKRLSVPNRPFYYCFGAVLVLQMATLLPPLNGWLHVSEVPTRDLALVIAVSFVLPILVVEIHKLIVHQMDRRAGRKR